MLARVLVYVYLLLLGLALILDRPGAPLAVGG